MRRFSPVLLLVLAAAAAASLSVPAPAQAAAACPQRFVCFFDKAGWKGRLEVRYCARQKVSVLTPAARRRVTSVINNCNFPVSLMAIDPVRPTGLRPPTTIVARRLWLWTLGGARRMDNRATHVRVG